MIQGSLSSGGACDVLTKVRSDSLQVSAVKIPGYDGGCILMFSLVVNESLLPSALSLCPCGELSGDPLVELHGLVSTVLAMSQ